MEKIPYLIIGGGVIGGAIANELSKDSSKEIYLVERNKKIEGNNQSSRNSGVIHAGLYYPKESEPLKARFCVEGNQLLYSFCRNHQIPHQKVGKLVVATTVQEEGYLLPLYHTALENSVPGVKLISGKEAQKMEPNIKVISALYAPTSGVIEPVNYVSKLVHLAKNKGVNFVIGTEVIRIIPKQNGFKIRTKSGEQEEEFETEILINAAGLYSDEIARMVNPNNPYQMEPIRGEAAKFYRGTNPDERRFMSGMNVYPTPYGILPNGEKLEASYAEFKKRCEDKKVSRTLGVHLTPTFDYQKGEYFLGKTMTIGPAAVGKIGKEDYQQTRPEEYYLERVKNFFPNLKLEDILLHQCGIRAKLKGRNDFVIERDPQFPNCLNLIGIDSPGLTSSLAIAKYVGDMIKRS